MKLQRHTLYLLRNGDTIGPLKRRSGKHGWPWADGWRSYTNQGRFGLNPDVDSQFDIISEVNHANQRKYEVSAA